MLCGLSSTDEFACGGLTSQFSVLETLRRLAWLFQYGGIDHRNPGGDQRAQCWHAREEHSVFLRPVPWRVRKDVSPKLVKQWCVVFRCGLCKDTNFVVPRQHGNRVGGL